MPLYDPNDEAFDALAERFRWFEDVIAAEYGEDETDAEIPDALNWLRLLPLEFQLGLSEVECSLIYQNPTTDYVCSVWDVTGEDDLPWIVFLADDSGPRLLPEYSLLAEEAAPEALDTLLNRAAEELPERLLRGEFDRETLTPVPSPSEGRGVTVGIDSSRLDRPSSVTGPPSPFRGRGDGGEGLTPAAIAALIAPAETRRMALTMAFSETVRFEGVGDALLRLDPKSDSIYPSQNLNNIWNLGVEMEPNEAQIDEINARYRAAKIPRRFFYLSPSPYAENIAAWLAARKFRVRNKLEALFADTAEALATIAANPPQTDLLIRRLEPGEAEALRTRPFPMDSWPPERWQQMIDLTRRPEFDLFFAFDKNDPASPVAAALLCVDNNLGWLGMAATLPAHRNRGAQTALLAARIARAAARRCPCLYSETYRDILAGSFCNLERAGLKPVYARPIYVMAD